MKPNESNNESTLRERTELRWSFLEEEPEPCVVVSQRMELVFINAAARSLIKEEWFGKRCFEVLPVADEKCAFACPTIEAVQTAGEVTYCEENIQLDGGPTVQLGVAVIPLTSVRVQDHAKAVFLLRRLDLLGDPANFQTTLLKDAESLRQRLVSHFGSA